MRRTCLEGDTKTCRWFAASDCAVLALHSASAKAPLTVATCAGDRHES